MQNELDLIKEELIKRIFILFIQKYEGNKSRFARDIGCNERTVRRLFENNQGMTINLFFKISNALQIDPSELISGLKINTTSSTSNL